MTETMTIPITMDGDEQVVRLPEEFRLSGTEVTLSRSGKAVVIEPVKPKMSRDEFDAIMAKLRAYHDIPFMPEGREQPPMPEDDIDLD